MEVVGIEVILTLPLPSAVLPFPAALPDPTPCKEPSVLPRMEPRTFVPVAPVGAAAAKEKMLTTASTIPEVRMLMVGI